MTTQHQLTPERVEEIRGEFEAKHQTPSFVYWNGSDYRARDGYEDSYAAERYGGWWEGYLACATAREADRVECERLRKQLRKIEERAQKAIDTQVAPYFALDDIRELSAARAQKETK